MFKKIIKFLKFVLYGFLCPRSTYCFQETEKAIEELKGFEELNEEEKKKYIFYLKKNKIEMGLIFKEYLEKCNNKEQKLKLLQEYIYKIEYRETGLLQKILRAFSFHASHANLLFYSYNKQKWFRYDQNANWAHIREVDHFLIERSFETCMLITPVLKNDSNKNIYDILNKRSPKEKPQGRIPYSLRGAISFALRELLLVSLYGIFFTIYPTHIELFSIKGIEVIIVYAISLKLFPIAREYLGAIFIGLIFFSENFDTYIIHVLMITIFCSLRDLNYLRGKKYVKIRYYEHLCIFIILTILIIILGYFYCNMLKYIIICLFWTRLSLLLSTVDLYDFMYNKNRNKAMQINWKHSNETFRDYILFYDKNIINQLFTIDEFYNKIKA